MTMLSYAAIGGNAPGESNMDNTELADLKC